MQATVSQASLRQFTRSLTCLAKYSDSASLRASSTELELSAISSAQAAYARTNFHWTYFDSYSLNSVNANGSITQETTDSDDEVLVRGSVNLKSALSVLKGHNVQDSIDKCDIIIVEGSIPANEHDPDDHIESKFVLRFYCKNGVLKTHRLPLGDVEDEVAPNIPKADPSYTGKIVSTHSAMNDVLENLGGLGKSDPALQWEFDAQMVKVTTIFQGGSKASDPPPGSLALISHPVLSRIRFTHSPDDAVSSSVSHDTSDFIEYSVPHGPIQMKFPWKEFDATLSLAEAMKNAITLYFTKPGAPLSIEIEGSQQNSLFVISTAPTVGFTKARAVLPTATTNATTAVAGGATLGKRARPAPRDSSSTPSSNTAVPEAGPSKKRRAIDANTNGASASSTPRSRSTSLDPEFFANGNAGSSRAGPSRSAAAPPAPAVASSTRSRLAQSHTVPPSPPVALLSPSKSNSPMPAPSDTSRERYDELDGDMGPNMAMDIDFNMEIPMTPPAPPEPDLQGDETGAHPQKRARDRSLSPTSRPLSAPRRKQRPLFIPSQSSQGADSPEKPSPAHPSTTTPNGKTRAGAEPLLSQMMPADVLEQMRETGLGFENMTQQELDQLLEDDDDLDLDLGGGTGKDVFDDGANNQGAGRGTKASRKPRVIEQDLEEEDKEMDELDEFGASMDVGASDVSYFPATQAAPKSTTWGGRAYQPLFD
ncbi:hypothetical protein DL93DRAFT_2168996 [Clavulina sp. PMI_390]|nr:hypothetical protein DL93DRAFT_2168996 [Clavulina sp. PMI_390]